jgi:hypothetical protein
MRPRKKGWPPSVLALAQAHPAIRLSVTPEVAYDPWWELASRLRQARFYLRFLDPTFRSTPALLRRARIRAPIPAVRLGETIGRIPVLRRLLVRSIGAIERSTGTAALFHDYLRKTNPDVVVSTPLVVLKTAQIDLARAAIELGIRNVFAVASWDHLSSKGELTFVPQHVLAWNEIQKREAVDLHGIPAERVTIVGAPVFDDWFDKRPASTRPEFLSRVGLPVDRPLLLYLCSGLLEGSPPEADFVLRWARYMRDHGSPALRACSILVRPHFKRGVEWVGRDFSGLKPMVCWPPAGEVPVDERSKTDYFDSMYHANAVAGLNTSAMIESAIVGKPVYAILPPEFHDNQEGTLHFHYLLDGPSALLHAARSFEDHARDLERALDGSDPDPERSARFIRTFVRPRGIDVSATSRVVDALEAIGSAPAPAPVPSPAWTRWLRPLLAPFARAATARVKRLEQELRLEKRKTLMEHRQRKAFSRREVT